MAKLTDDILRWSLEINGNPAQKALGELEQSTRSLEQTNKELRVELQKLEAAGKKNSQEYKELEQQFKKNNTTIAASKEKMGEMRKEIGINSLTARQLRDEYRRLKIQIDSTTPNTPEWKKYNDQLKAVKDRQNELNVGTSKASSLFGGLKALLPALGISALIGGIVKLGKEFLNLATSMEQTERKAKIVFGDSLPMVTKAAAENAKQLGLTRNEFIKAAASTADLLVPLGFARDRSADLSVKLTNLSGALDEWSGGTLGAAQVNEILTKAMLGEAEQIKQLGIVIDQSSQDYNNRIKVMMETEGVTKEQARALDILNQIYSKSADAQTAFAQKGESLLRTQKNLSTWWRQLKEDVVGWFEIPTERKIEQERAGLNLLVNSLMSVNNDQETRNRLIKELQGAYPAFLQNMNLEDLNYENLSDRLKDYNEQYDIRVKNAVYEKQMADVTEEQRKNYEKQVENIVMINNLYGKYVVNKKADATFEEKLRALREDELNGLTQNLGIRAEARRITREQNELTKEEIKLQGEYNEVSSKRVTPESPKPSPPAPLTEGQISDYYEAVKTGVVKGEGDVRALTQQELDKLADIRKQNEEERLNREKDAADKRRRQSEAEAAEQQRLAEQQAAEQQRLLESQEAVRQQIIRGSRTLIEKENLDYADRLQAAGLYGKNLEEMTDEELQALEILEREHQQTIKEISDQSFNDNLSDMSVRFDREKTVRERKYNEELLSLGNNEEAKKALTEQYRREELQKQAEHLQALVSQYEAELNQGVISSLFASIPDMSIEEALLTDEEKGNLVAKIEELKAKLSELGISMAELNESGKEEPEKKDIFGMTPEDWEDFEGKFMYAIGLAQEASDMWAGFNRIRANKDRAEMQEFEANTNKRKQILDRQLKNQEISQKQYDQAISSMEAATESRRIKVAQDAARREKSQAYFNTVVNTAAAVVKMLMDPGGVLGFVLAALAAATGAVQLGIIASEPLPQMQEGGFVKVQGKDDKKQYRAMMAPDKRGLIKGPTILVAENKPEYVVPGKLLESNPTVRKYVDEIETIRTNRQFQNGGFTQDGSYRVGENLIEENTTVQKYVYVIDKISSVSDKVDTREIESIYEFFRNEIDQIEKLKTESLIKEKEQIKEIHDLQTERSQAVKEGFATEKQFKTESLTREKEQISEVTKEHTRQLIDRKQQLEQTQRTETNTSERITASIVLERQLISQRNELVDSFISESVRIQEMSATLKQNLISLPQVEVKYPKTIQPVPFITTISQPASQRNTEMVTNNNTTIEKTFTDPQLIEALNRFSQIMEQIDRNGLEVPWVKIKEKFDQYDQIQSRVNSR
jgi:hypothetical protein